MALLPVLEGLHSAETFNPAFLEACFQRTRALEAHPDGFHDALRGRVVATLFEEPSTRTRLSFESAALRLGAGVISVADPRTSSMAKGESLRDSARIVSAYADLIVWRHPRDGATRLAAQAAAVPVLNAGDGRTGHPTQTLLDLYTLHREWGSLAGRTVGIMGDLRHGRTARSLAWGLALLEARLVLLPAPGLDWEPALAQRIAERAGMRPRTVRHPLFRHWTGSESAVALEPQSAVQGFLFGGEAPLLDRLDALYLTRLQVERGAEPQQGVYPGLQSGQLADPLLSQCLILHPLPRRNELPPEIDGDPRARYFPQASLGVAVRQALYLGTLRADRWPLPELTPLPAGNPDAGLGPCPNENCVTRQEGIPVPWRVAGRTRRMFLCAYCDSVLPVDYAGCRSTRRLHALHSGAVLRILPENLRPFRVKEAALRDGYVWSEG